MTPTVLQRMHGCPHGTKLRAWRQASEFDRIAQALSMQVRINPHSGATDRLQRPCNVVTQVHLTLYINAMHGGTVSQPGRAGPHPDPHQDPSLRFVLATATTMHVCAASLGARPHPLLAIAIAPLRRLDRDASEGTHA